MSASPETSAHVPQERASGSPSPPPSGLETEAKHDIDSQKDEEGKNGETQPSEEPETDASKSHPDEHEQDELTSAPPLPAEVPPPLPTEAPPAQADDGWEPAWDATAGAYYFYNRFTGVSQWENPRVPELPAAAAIPAAPGTEASHPSAAPKKEPVLGGYNPAIHGDYDPTAPYAQYHEEPAQPAHAVGFDPSAAYAATGTFNRFTGRWQAATINPDNHNDENKSRRQMNAYFDVDAAANSHNGRSLRAERSAKKLTKQELKQFKEKRREKKEEKRRAWLRD
ncbi:hypothetical protein N7527_000277 [Penicillium freii]|nr:hypothetical protein N7527_000277 [Penicillium freii]